MKKTSWYDFWAHYNFSEYKPMLNFGLNRSSRLKNRSYSAWIANKK